MNPYEEEQFITEEEQFEIIDSLFDEDDTEDESTSEFFIENA